MKKSKQYADEDRRSSKKEATTRGYIRARSTEEDKFTLEVTSPLTATWLDDEVGALEVTSPLTATWLRDGEVGTRPERRHITMALAPPAQSAQAVHD
jgi:hypothetical protein